MAREIYYLVESFSTATAANPNYTTGELHTSINGKGDINLLYEISDGHRYCDLITPSMVRKHGYKRECDAKRNWSYRNPENTRFWKTDVHIIRAWVRHDGTIWFC